MRKTDSDNSTKADGFVGYCCKKKGTNLRVGHPTARLDLVGVETPKVELLLEERSAHVSRVVKLSGAIVIEHLRKNTGVPVEKVLVQYAIVVGQRLREPGQPGRRDLLQGGLVRLVPDATHVQDHSVLRIHVRIHFSSVICASRGADALFQVVELLLMLPLPRASC